MHGSEFRSPCAFKHSVVDLGFLAALDTMVGNLKKRKLHGLDGEKEKPLGCRHGERDIFEQMGRDDFNTELGDPPIVPLL